VGSTIVTAIPVWQEEELHEENKDVICGLKCGYDRYFIEFFDAFSFGRDHKIEFHNTIPPSQ
jgi:hypothetical protein